MDESKKLKTTINILLGILLVTSITRWITLERLQERSRLEKIRYEESLKVELLKAVTELRFKCK